MSPAQSISIRRKRTRPGVIGGGAFSFACEAPASPFPPRTSHLLAPHAPPLTPVVGARRAAPPLSSSRSRGPLVRLKPFPLFQAELFLDLSQKGCPPAAPGSPRDSPETFFAPACLPTSRFRGGDGNPDRARVRTCASVVLSGWTRRETKSSRCAARSSRRSDPRRRGRDVPRERRSRRGSRAPRGHVRRLPGRVAHA